MKLRRILKGLLAEYIIIGDLDWEKSIDDWRFTDLEDSYQYQAALVSECDVFLTLNIRDFKQVISSAPDAMQVCSPDGFIARYCK